LQKVLWLVQEQLLYLRTIVARLEKEMDTEDERSLEELPLELLVPKSSQEHEVDTVRAMEVDHDQGRDRAVDILTARSRQQLA